MPNQLISARQIIFEMAQHAEKDVDRLPIQAVKELSERSNFGYGGVASAMIVCMSIAARRRLAKIELLEGAE